MRKVTTGRAAHSNLKGFLLRNKRAFEFLEKRKTKHAIEAAKAADIPLKSIAKTLVFVDEKNKPFAVVVRADCKVNRHSLQNASSRKSVKLADDKLAEKLTGFPTGGIPPIGHRISVPVLIDRSIIEMSHVWCGGGSRSKLVKLKVSDIIELSNGKVHDFSTKT